MLKTLSDFPRRVVLTCMNYVSSQEREKVIDYARKINDSLGLPPMIVLEDEQRQDIGRIVRNFLPAPNELNKLKEARSRTIFLRTVSKVIVALEQTINDATLQEEKEAKLSHERAKRLRDSWEELHTTAVQQQLKTTEEIIANITPELRKIFQVIMSDGQRSGYSSSWFSGVQSEVLDRISSLINIRQDDLEKKYTHDLSRITDDASFMKLDDFNFIDTSLSDIAGSSIRFDSSVGSGPKKYGAMIGTGLAVGACLLAPIPMTAKVISSAAVFAGGVTLVEKMKAGTKAAFLEAKISRQISKITADIEEILRELCEKRYKPLISYIGEEYKKAGNSDEVLSTLNSRKNYLERLISECNNMKEEYK